MGFIKCFEPLCYFQRHFHRSKSNRLYKKLPTYWDVVTGKERWEACQHAKGNIDPFMEHPVVQSKDVGTKDCPIVVPSIFEYRHVICICMAGKNLARFCLHDGFPRRCFCNKWFVLERICPPKIYEDQPDD